MSMPRQPSENAIRRIVVYRIGNIGDILVTLPALNAIRKRFPGAHIDVHMPSGLVRQYSLNGDPGTRDFYRIAVRRIPDGGGGSIEMHVKCFAYSATWNA